MAAPHGTRRLLGHPEEEARTDPCFGQGRAWPRLSHQRFGKRMKPAINDASARQRSGGSSPIADLTDNRYNRLPRGDLTGVERQIAELVDRSTQDLRVAWREL